jgi:hypothetical protein
MSRSILIAKSAWHVSCALAAWLLCPAMTIAAAIPVPQTFASPEAGVHALVEAVKANDQSVLHAMLGPGSDALISSGDSIEDAHSRKVFLHVYAVAHRVVHQDDAHAVLIIGRAERPMPIPLVRDAKGWHFDTARGEAQILQHRIAHNEIDAMQACLAIVYAERQYATNHPSRDGAPIYTARLRSSVGQHDGLYWPTNGDEPPSLLGVLLADAVIQDGYSPPGVSSVQPYLGYLYRIVTPSGASTDRNFTVMAYPASYGASGIRSFFVGADGMVYGKDLGTQTSAIVKVAHGFRPSDGWKLSRPVD